jgi:hypothetical protein
MSSSDEPPVAGRDRRDVGIDGSERYLYGCARPKAKPASLWEKKSRVRRSVRLLGGYRGPAPSGRVAESARTSERV